MALMVFLAFLTAKMNTFANALEDLVLLSTIQTFLSCDN
jgi:hypothetical protein